MAIRILQDADGNSTVIKLRPKQQPVEVPPPSLLTKKRLKKLDEKLNKLQKEFGLEKATALVGAGASAANLAREQGRTTHSAQAAWHRQQASECQTAGCQADDDGDETGADNNFRAAGRHMQAASMHDQAAATRTPTAVRNAWNQSARAQMSAPVGAPPAVGGPKGSQSGKRVVMTPEDEKPDEEYPERSVADGDFTDKIAKAWSDAAREAAAEARKQGGSGEREKVAQHLKENGFKAGVKSGSVEAANQRGAQLGAKEAADVQTYNRGGDSIHVAHDEDGKVVGWTHQQGLGRTGGGTGRPGMQFRQAAGSSAKSLGRYVQGPGQFGRGNPWGSK